MSDEGVVIGAVDTEATLVPELGMLGASFRFRGEEYVALPGGLTGYRDGHQTGLPLLAPWANRLGGWRYQAAGTSVDLAGLHLHTDENGLPIHGTMTAATGWDVVERTERRLRARFDYGARPELLAAFPFPHELDVEASVGEGALHIATTLRATGDRPVPVAFGWHPYLQLPRGDRSSWRLGLPAREHLDLDATGIPTGDGREEPAELDPIGPRTFDDLYALHHEHELGIDGGGRSLTVRCDDGYPYAQVFVPPSETFVCLEPMTAPTNALLARRCPMVAPGESLTARFSIVVG